MANSGWDGRLQEERFKVGGCFACGPGSAPHDEWFDVRELVFPTTTGEQLRNKGWSRLDRPVANDGNDNLPGVKYLPGIPGREYNTAAQEPPGM